MMRGRKRCLAMLTFMRIEFAVLAFAIACTEIVCSQERDIQFVVTTNGGTGLLGTEERSRLSLFLDLYALGHDEDNNCYYALAGMPVQAAISLNKRGAKKGRRTFPPVQIACDWTSQVEFSVSRAGGEVISNMAPRFISYSGTWVTNDVCNDPAYGLHGYWAMDEAATTSAAGEYVVRASWRGLVRDCRVMFRAPVGSEETSKVKLARARVLIERGAYNSAIAIVDEVMRAHGAGFGFPSNIADQLMGDALTGANRLTEALAVRRASLARIEAKLAEVAPDAIGSATMGVRYQIAQLEERIAAGSSGGVP